MPIFESARANNVDVQNNCLYASIGEQKLHLWTKNSAPVEYPVSTSRKPPSCVENSLGTPLGWHKVVKKIGAGEPAGMVFIGRKPTGKCYWEYPVDDSENRITTRILRLRGLQPGLNSGPGVDTYDRYVYIHGTNQEDRIGSPNSHGCILLANADVIELFEIVPANTPLLIDD